LIEDVETGLGNIAYTDVFASFGSQKQIQDDTNLFRKRYPPLTES